MPKSNLLLYLETHSIDRVVPTTATSFRRVLALPIGQDPVFERVRRCDPVMFGTPPS